MTESEEPETGGVLASLPSTRPQRRSAKRAPATGRSDALTAAAKPRTKTARPKAGAGVAGASKAGAAKGGTNAPGTARGRRPPAAPKATPTARPRQQPASVGAGGARRPARPAAQGFGPDTARGAVEPPSRADVIGSVAQGAGDLVHVGLDLGRVLLRSVVRRLPGK